MIDEVVDKEYDVNCGNSWIPVEPSISNGYLIAWVFSLIVLMTLAFILF